MVLFQSVIQNGHHLQPSDRQTVRPETQWTQLKATDGEKLANSPKIVIMLRTSSPTSVRGLIVWTRSRHSSNLLTHHALAGVAHLPGLLDIHVKSFAAILQKGKSIHGIVVW